MEDPTKQESPRYTRQTTVTLNGRLYSVRYVEDHPFGDPIAIDDVEDITPREIAREVRQQLLKEIQKKINLEKYLARNQEPRASSDDEHE